MHKTEFWMEELSKQERLDKTFMDFAESLANLSHCVRVQVGAVITRDNRVISTGYNGTPAGYVNCDYHFKDDSRARDDLTFRHDHGLWSKHEVHAEQNAILMCAKNGIPVNEGTIYTTISPCMDCAKAIIQSGIKRVVYLVEYDRDSYPLTFLKDCGIKVEKWDLNATQKHTS